MNYKINQIQINTDLREIQLDGIKQSIEPKVYDLIIFLIENPNKAISKDELQDAVWPNLEVSETAITRAIMKARKVLNDGKNTQSYIQTVHGHGYKFIANIEVESVIVPEFETKIKNQHSFETNQSKINSKFTVLAVLVLLSFIGVGFLYLTESGNVASDQKLAILPIINETNDDNYSWTSIGLMSLISQIIQSKNSIPVLSDVDTVAESKNFNNLSMSISESKVEEIKNKLKVSHFVLSSLSKISENKYQLLFSIFHPKGSYADIQMQGDNPTNLAQNMAQKISQLLPGNNIAVTYDVISTDVFTNELYSRGMSFQIQGYADKARNYFELAIEQDPELFSPRLELAIIKRKQGDYQGSIDDLLFLKEFIKSRSNNPVSEVQINNSLGIAYFRLKENQKALEFYNHAYELAVELKNLNYQSTTATNIGIIYKNEGLYDKARVWVLKAMSVDKVNSDVASASSIYLLGQIERQFGNIEKAEELFVQAKQLFLNDDLLRQATAVASAHSRLLIMTGNYQEALKMLDETHEYKLKLNDSIGVADAKLSYVTLFLQQGEYSKARQALNTAMQYIEEHNIISRKDFDYKEDIYIDFYQGKYDVVINKINNNSKQIESITLEMMAMKSQQKLGDGLVIKQWLEKNQSLNSGTNNNMRLYFLDLENYYLADYGTEDELIESYQNRINLSRSIGHDATAVEVLIKLAYLYLNQNNLEKAQNILNEIQLFELNWWQIDLLKAAIEFENGNLVSAKKLAKNSKQNSTQAWSQENELIFQKIIN
jgi:DNA-binding winged helix-turn-helix (wHTH) protein/tetratricopeptide (TPR) repeat protein